MAIPEASAANEKVRKIIMDGHPGRIVHMNGEDGSRMRFRHHRGPFLGRLHFALMALRS